MYVYIRITMNGVYVCILYDVYWILEGLPRAAKRFSVWSRCSSRICRTRLYSPTIITSTKVIHKFNIKLEFLVKNENKLVKNLKKKFKFKILF